jgi:hypothetical protein
MRTASRRGVLGGLAALGLPVVTPIAAQSCRPGDAILIEASNRLRLVMKEYEFAEEERREDLDAIENQLLEAILDTEAKTPAGLQAKARAALEWFTAFSTLAPDTEAELMASVCRDVLAGDPAFLARLDAEWAQRCRKQEASFARLQADYAAGKLGDTRSAEEKLEDTRRAIPTLEAALERMKAEVAAGAGA